MTLPEATDEDVREAIEEMEREREDQTQTDILEREAEREDQIDLGEPA